MKTSGVWTEVWAGYPRMQAHSVAIGPVCSASFSSSHPALCSSHFPSFLTQSSHYFHNFLHLCPFIFFFLRFLLFSFLCLSVPFVFFVIISCFLCTLFLSFTLFSFIPSLSISSPFFFPASSSSCLNSGDPRILTRPTVGSVRIRQEHVRIPGSNQKEGEAEED